MSTNKYPYINHMNILYDSMQLIDVPSLVKKCTPFRQIKISGISTRTNKWKGQGVRDRAWRRMLCFGSSVFLVPGSGRAGSIISELKGGSSAWF